jgi:hypothetical protein
MALKSYENLSTITMITLINYATTHTIQQLKNIDSGTLSKQYGEFQQFSNTLLILRMKCVLYSYENLTT